MGEKKHDTTLYKLKATTMKKDNVTSIELVLCSLFCLCLGFIVCLGMQVDNRGKIDLPEEYPLISRDSSKPDQLEGFFRNDTLVIQFKIKE